MPVPKTTTRRRDLAERVVAQLFWAALLAGSQFSPQTATGDTVWLRDSGAAPLNGRIVSIADDLLQIAVDRESGPELLSIPRSGVLGWHEAIDETRLEALDGTRPGDYLTLAIELSACRFDPSARRLAIELALIALNVSASNGDRSTARRAWLLLNAELEKPDERERCLVAGQQLGLVAAAFPTTSAPNETATAQNEASRQQLLELVRGLRQGRPAAIAAWPPPGELEQLLKPWRLLVTAEDLWAWRSEANLLPSALLQLLDLETALEQGRQPAPADPGDWSVLARLEPVAVANPREAIARITGFDPGVVRWREGTWREAASAAE